MTPARASTLVLAALVLGASPGIEGCRACGDRASPDAAAEPPMPTGMLVQAPIDAAAPPDARAGVTELIPAAAGDTDGQRLPDVVPGARVLALDTTVLLHDTFARAKPGFDPFRPHLFDVAALKRLDAELGAFEAEWRALDSAAAARARFGDAEMLRGAPLDEDAAWGRVKSGVAAQVAELRQTCRAQVEAGRGLWVRSR